MKPSLPSVALLALALSACSDDAGDGAPAPNPRPEAAAFADGRFADALASCETELAERPGACEAQYCASLARFMIWLDDFNGYLLPTFRGADIVNADPQGPDLERLTQIRNDMEVLSTALGGVIDGGCQYDLGHLPLRIGDEADPIVLADVRGHWTPRAATFAGAVVDSVRYIFDATVGLAPAGPPPPGSDVPALPDLLEAVAQRLKQHDQAFWAEPTSASSDQGGFWDRDGDGRASDADALLIDFFEPGSERRLFDFEAAELVRAEELPLRPLTETADLPPARCEYQKFHVDTLYDTNVGTTDGMDFSPDGKRIVFPMRVDGRYQLHLAELDVSRKSPTCLTCDHEPKAWNDGVRWKPQSDALVFVSGRDHPYAIGGAGGGFGQELYAMKLDGSKLSRLTTSSTWATNYHVNFSHDGARIVWGTTENRTWDVMVADLVEGATSFGLENIRRLTHDTSWWETHGFSHDGRSVITTNTRAGWQSADLYAIDVESGERRRLTDDPTWDEHAHLSPDGRKLSWISARFQPASVSRLTDGAISASHDFFWIAPAIFFNFINPPSGFRTELTLMDADGADLRALTDDGEVVADNAWSPDGTRILFRQTPTGTKSPAKLRLLTFDDCQ
jgi:Tol biopolymer transport system component